MKPKSPCLGCSERHSDCHTACFAFNVYRARLRKWKDLILAEKPIKKIYKEDSKSVRERRSRKR